MEINEVVAKLTASKKLLITKINGRDSTAYIRVLDVKSVYQRYSEIRTLLQSVHHTLFADLPQHPIPPKITTINEYPMTHISYVEGLVHDMDYCLDLLSSVNNLDGSSAKVTREGVFLTGQFFDALLKINDLIRQAQTSIIIVDGYINEDVLKLLTAKLSGVAVQILTKSVPQAVSTVAIAFNKQYSGLGIRTSQSFHDRFVIIDDCDFYHFGASIKDLGNRGFMFSRIEEPIVINALRTEVKNEWTKATVIV